MGIINYYDIIGNRKTVTQEAPKPSVEEVSKGRPILQDAVPVTLAEFDPTTKNAIMAHRLKDYRRKTFRLSLLPDVHIMLDDIMEGSTFWNEKLHNESPYA